MTCATTVSSCSRPGAGANLDASCPRTLSQPSAWPRPPRWPLPLLLERIRTATEGPLLLVKGPEVARLYPDPALRSFRDLDILVPDAPATQRQLLAAGFQETGDPRLYEQIHHLRPLFWPGLPLLVEVHSSPKWIASLDPPPAAELIRTAARSQAGPPGVLAPSPAQHALLLAAHAWAHRPLSRLRDLIDIAVVAARSRASRDPGAGEVVGVAARVGHHRSVPWMPCSATGRARHR